MYHTQNLGQFINHFGNASLNALEGSFEKGLKVVTTLLKSLRPTITYNSITGAPEIDFNAHDEVDAKYGIEQIFRLLKNEKRTVMVVFDEFQQIGNYPESNTEALLRTYIQEAENVRFIFSGSAQSLLISMFADYGRPFYQSTEMMQINEIHHAAYTDFIINHFRHAGKVISEESVGEILALCLTHTYYVQFFCNKLYGAGIDNIGIGDVQQMLLDILKENEPLYDTYKQIMPSKQFMLLVALAKERYTKKVLKGEFINRYQLGSASSVRFSLQSLIDKDLVHKCKEGVRVSDVFLMHWLCL